MKSAILSGIILSSLAAPAFAGPYVKTGHKFTGVDEDYGAAQHQVRLGYETKVGVLVPYIEGGFGVVYPDAGESSTVKALEVGTKMRLTEKLSANAKFENIFKDSDGSRNWKVELKTKYSF